MPTILGMKGASQAGLGAEHGRRYASSRLAAVTLAAFILLPAIALSRGQDINWDQLNYHLYVADAALRGTYAYNVAPAQMQSWFNPIAYIPSYWLGGRLSPFGVKLTLSLVHALNAPILFLIALEVQPRDRNAAPFALLATLIGMTTATFLGEAGTTFFDITATLFTSGALLLGLQAGRSQAKSRQVSLLVIAGGLIGLATGLKLTNAVYALALGIALTAAAPRHFLRNGGVYAAGATLGFLVAAGWWMAVLWAQYGNPFFPYFNGVFHSAWLDGVPSAIASGNGADTRFIPPTLMRALQLPLVWAIGSSMTSEYWYRDPRVLIAVLLAIAAGVAALAGHRERRGTAAPGHSATLVITYAGVSLVIWMKAFAIQRYFIPVEVLSGIVMLIALRRLTSEPRTALIMFGIVAVATIALTRAPAYGDIAFQDSTIPSRGLRPLYRPGALYVMTGNAPLGFVVPALPDDVRFVRVGGNMPLDPAKGLGRAVSSIVALHREPLYSLEIPEELNAAAAPLARFGLAAAGPCLAAKGLNQDIVACPLRRATTAARPR